MGELSNRRRQTKKRISKLNQKLRSAEVIAARKACVYATGSFGRREASIHSDLDLFIVGKNTKPDADGKIKSRLARLDDIRIKAKLVETTRALGIPEFSGDGKYLLHYSVSDLTRTLGKADDDASNTFTARLLLLLESCPLVEKRAYQKVIKEVISAYWGDYKGHEKDFMPAFLANDILRLWRTFCVNYEANTAKEPADKKAKRKLQNYKLKYSRLLTCYSALLYLLAVFVLKKTVSPIDALKMISLTPTQRLEWLRKQSHFKKAHSTIDKLLSEYECFLSATNFTEKTLVARFKNKTKARKFFQSANNFGDLIFQALNEIGDGKTFHRLLIV